MDDDLILRPRTTESKELSVSALLLPAYASCVWRR